LAAGDFPRVVNMEVAQGLDRRENAFRVILRPRVEFGIA
jgi:hypothetical protein